MPRENDVPSFVQCTSTLTTFLTPPASALLPRAAGWLIVTLGACTYMRLGALHMHQRRTRWTRVHVCNQLLVMVHSCRNAANELNLRARVASPSSDSQQHHGSLDQCKW